MYTQKKSARYAYIAPFYRQAKDVAWQYLKEATAEFAIAVRESDLRVILPNGAWVTLYGADNPDALRGLYLDGVILDEYGDCRPGLWGQVVLPTLADRKGWAIFIGTPKGNNHFKATFDKAHKEGWFAMHLKASQSGILDEEELAEMRKQMTPEEYDQEMECSFQAALLGAYYGDLMADAENDGRIGEVPWDPDYPVHVSSDLGFTDSTAFWFWQVRPDGLAFIDYEEHHSKKLDFYFELLQDKPYEYDTIWLPHDARAKTLQTGKSTIEQFRSVKDQNGDQRFPVKIAPKLGVQDGINAVRRILATSAFDAVETYDGVEALKAYRRDYDDLKRAFSKSPRHDWSSHGADAMRIAAVVSNQAHLVSSGDYESRKERKVVKSIDDFTLDELHMDNTPAKVISLASRRRV